MSTVCSRCGKAYESSAHRCEENDFTRSFDRLFGYELVKLREGEHWRKAMFDVLKAYVTMYDCLTATQARCTELLEENRVLKRTIAEMKQGILLPGFTCSSCLIFNGDEKERRTTCRSCDAPRPTVVSTT